MIGRGTHSKVAFYCGSILILAVLIAGAGCIAHGSMGIEWSTPLHDAVEKGDLKKVKQLLEDGADPNKGIMASGLHGRGTTAVDVALRHGEMEILEVLLENGGEIHPWDLDDAVRGGHIEMVRFVIEQKGVHAASHSDHGEYALVTAVEYGYWEIADYLIEKGGAANGSFKPLSYKVEEKGVRVVRLMEKIGALEDEEILKLAFDFAVRGGQDEAVKELIKLGAGASFPTRELDRGKTVLQLTLPTDKNSRNAIRTLIDAGARADIPALEWMHASNSTDEIPEDAAEFYLEAGAFDGVELSGPDRMMLAALCRDTEEIEKLAAEGIDPGAESTGGRLPLSMAIIYSDTATVRALLDAGANPNPEVRHSNHLPLLNASHYGQPGMVKALVEAGADVNAVVIISGASTKGSLLADVADRSRVEAMQVLIEADADLNAMPGGVTPLFKAAGSHYGYEGAKLLLESGADPNIAAWNGWTALDAAIAENRPETAKLIREHGGQESGNRVSGERFAYDMSAALRHGYVKQAEGYGRNTAQHSAHMIKQALEKGADDLASSLIENGTPLEEESERKANHRVRRDNLLVHAVRGNCTRAAKLLLENGYEINYRSRNGKSLLAIAGENWNQPMIELLIERGADFAWESPHVYVAEGKLKQLKELVILNPKALTVKDPNGYRPLHWAAAFGQKEMVKWLILQGSPLEFDDDKLSTSELAQRAGHTELLDLLSGKEEVKRPQIQVAPWYAEQKRRETEEKKD